MAMAICSSRSLEVQPGSWTRHSEIAARIPIIRKCSVVALHSNGMSTVCHTAYPIVRHSLGRFRTGGKCAVCGEPFDTPVKLFEKGGSMYKGTVVKTHNQGEQIEVKVMVSHSRT